MTRSPAARLAQQRGTALAGLVRTVSVRQPIFALLHRRLLPDLVAALDYGEHRVGHRLQAIGAREATFDAADASLTLSGEAALRAAESLARQPESAGESGAATNL